MKYNHWKANQINPFIFISKMPQIRKDGTKAPNHVVLVRSESTTSGIANSLFGTLWKRHKKKTKEQI